MSKPLVVENEVDFVELDRKASEKVLQGKMPASQKRYLLSLPERMLENRRAVEEARNSLYLKFAQRNAPVR